MLYDFSSKELEVLKYAALPIKEISLRLNLSEGAIKSRLTSAVKKTNAQNRFMAQFEAIKRGLITIEEIITE